MFKTQSFGAESKFFFVILQFSTIKIKIQSNYTKKNYTQKH